jgi:hypothetical protein
MAHVVSRRERALGSIERVPSGFFSIPVRPDARAGTTVWATIQAFVLADDDLGGCSVIHSPHRRRSSPQLICREVSHETLFYDS